MFHKGSPITVVKKQPLKARAAGCRRGYWIAVLAVLWTAGCLAPFGAYAQDPGGCFISEPMFGMPALWLRGTSSGPCVVLDLSGAGIEQSAAASMDATVVLEKANGPVPFEVALPVLDGEYTGARAKLYLGLSEDIPADLYDLHVSLQVEGKVISCRQPNAVKIIARIKDTYAFVHVTDVHVDDPRGCAGNCRETAGYQVIDKMLGIINLIDPEFVVITGDHLFGMNYAREYTDLYALLQGFDVPVFMMIGNHDAINHAYRHEKIGLDGMEMFEQLFAPLHFTFRYGGLSCIALNSADWSAFERRGAGIVTPAIGGQIRQEQLDWFEDELAAADADLIIAAYHHPPHHSFRGTGAEQVMGLARDYGVGAVLTGHTHRDEVMKDGEVIYLTTASVLFNAYGDSYPAFRICDVADNELIAWNYREPHWSVPIYRDSGPADTVKNLSEPSLYCRFSPANDGSSPAVTATVFNHLARDFQAVSIELVVPAPQAGATYRVSGGSVHDVYDTGGAQIWYVTAEINAHSSCNVTIREIKE